MVLIVKIKKKLRQFTLEADFKMEENKIAVLGESGAGKSMLLKCITGIETPDSGQIILNNRILYDSNKRINLPIQERKIGYLFQDYALFPNMTVQKNLEISLPKRENTDTVTAVIHSFGLEGLEQQYPKQLSGGQKQRVALARILVSKPAVIFLDEPFSALNQHLKWKMEEELLDILDSFQGTVVFVSHDQEEVLHISEQTLVIHDGKIGEIKPTKMLFDKPETYAEAMLAGYENIVLMSEVVAIFPAIPELQKQDGQYLVFSSNAIHIRKQATRGSVPFVCIRKMQERDSVTCILKPMEKNTSILTIRFKDVTGEIKVADVLNLALQMDKVVYVT